MARTIHTSEYCSVGHPDRTCDYIVAYILDREEVEEAGFTYYKIG